jgi:hypothetical protein
MPATYKGSPAAVNYARINNAAAAGDTVVVAGVAGQSVRVYGLRLSVAGATIVSIKDGAGTVLEVFNFAGAGVAPPLDLRDETYYTTVSGNGLIVNSSAAVQVDGRLEYFQGKA